MNTPEILTKAALWRALTTLRYNRAANQEERDAVVLPFLYPLERELTAVGYVFENGSMVPPALVEEVPSVPVPEPEPSLMRISSERFSASVPKPEQVVPEPIKVLPDAIATKTVPEPDEPAPHRKVFPKKVH